MTSAVQQPLPDQVPGRPKIPPTNNPPRPQGHQYSASSTGLATSKSRRSLAALARDKVAGFASLGTNAAPPLRSATSSASLQKQTVATTQTRPDLPRNITSPPAMTQRAAHKSQSQASTEPLIPTATTRTRNNMHQSSSRAVRMNSDNRPWTREFKDLFATLVTSLPIAAHRVRFVKQENTFLSEEAIVNLGSLKFAQSNRIPDPQQLDKWVITTTTTTFSMDAHFCRKILQQFVDARFMESAEGKIFPEFPLKGAVWRLTPKGMAILNLFADRNGTDPKTIEPFLRRTQMQILVLEREPEDDQLIQDKTTIGVVFRRMCGVNGPNLKSSTAQSDSDSVSDYTTGLVGVKMAKDRRVFDKTIPFTFTGKAASDWLLDCCTTVTRGETYELCELFLKSELMAPVVEDRNYMRLFPKATHFQPTKYAIYAVTEKGQRICGWLARPASLSSEDSVEDKDKLPMPRDTSMNKFHMIVTDPALRMLFREHLRASLCEENLYFWLDAQDFLSSYRAQEKAGKLHKNEVVKECLATAYGLYNSFLAAGAPSELNIDHTLRNRLDSHMIKTDTDPDAMRLGLETVIELIELVTSSVAKLMASDSVPKFLRDPKYQNIIREHQINMSLAHRALSPAPSPGSTTKGSEKTVSRSNTNRVAKP